MDDHNLSDDAGDEAFFEASTWFQPHVRYEGYGRAEFEDPHGFVEGPTLVEFDETGVARGQMSAMRVTADEDLPVGPAQLFEHDRPVQEEGGFSLTTGLDSKANDCVGLVVQTPDGLFVAKSPIGYGHTQSWSINEPEQLTLTFQLFNGSLLISDVLPAYWILPLTNFVSPYRPAPSALSQHPLRLRHVPPAPEDSSDRDALLAHLNAAAQNRLIAFDYKDLPAFIEPLLDHEERERRLQEGRDRRLVTAVAVGALPGDIDDDERVERLLPQDLLLLLSLATGSEVGAPWIELRDGQGELLARLHSHRGRPHFAPGHRAIDEAIHGGIGTLLTYGSKSAIYDSAMLRVTAKHLLRAGQRNLTAEDRFSHLCRAFEGLCKWEGIRASVKATTQLENADATALKEVLDEAVDEAVKEVRKLVGEAKQNGNDEAAKILTRVAGRIPVALELGQGFGRNVVALIARFGYPDADIVATFLQANPRSDKRDWPDMLGYYRGLVMHIGYLDVDRNPDARKDVGALIDHLHDVLLRMLLQRLGYSGTYQPTVINVTVDWPIDWVTAETPPHRLGYE